MVKRVLHWGLQGGIGGVETFVINLYRHIDRDKVQFDFLTNEKSDVAFSEEIEAMGGMIYREIVPKSISIIRHQQSYTDFFEKIHVQDFIAVHQHSNFPRYIAPLKYAKKYGIKKRIYHAHNCQDMHPSKSLLVNAKKRITEFCTIQNLGRYATDLLACSEKAGEFMYQNKYPSVFIPNAIETDRFVFNENKRAIIRRELQLGEAFTVGFVGRLQYQKNPEFLINVFESIHKWKPDSKLVCVGVGTLEEKCRKMVADKGLEEATLFLGIRNDVPDLLQAFDCMVMPSRFEGLGITYIEAQAAGLQTYGSDEVPIETEITGLMHRIPLALSADEWAGQVLSFIETKRRNTKSEICQAGFDIKDLAKRMENFYLGTKI